ncbi:hypothetical protein NDN08_003041 [Rhodosorus marinus]|uniref:Structural maintenance of chromosomes protein n=1 Tax=Rhodosorus marinus TaxID=101924 RepID=A0AAV8UZH2_9RHOD|nr:hypothetical protein NDN08_003041 [Rhodosorus marinus]
MENFKSFAEKTVVGPLRPFTAIVGPNGSGKSNLMDAISFAVGEKTHTLRGKQLRDIAYRKPDEESSAERSRTCQVSLFIVDDVGKETCFSRRLTPSGSSEYKIGRRTVTHQVYSKSLESIGIFNRARCNFLVFQNEVQNIANQSPKDFGTVFELASGSGELRDEYNNKKQLKDNAEENVVFIFKKKRGLISERKQYKRQQDEAQQYHKILEKLEECKSDQASFRLYHMNKELKSLEENLSEELREMTLVKTKTDELETAIDNGRKELASMNMEKTVKLRRKQSTAAESEKHRPDGVRILTQLQRVRSRIRAEEKALEKARDEQRKHTQELASLEASHRDLSDAMSTIEAELVDAQGTEVSRENIREYKNLKDSVETQASISRRELAAAERSRRLVLQKKTTLEARRDQLKAELEISSAEISTFQEGVERSKSKLAAAQGAASTLRLELESMREEALNRKRQREDLEKTASDTSESLREANANTAESAKEQRFQEALQSMKRMYPGVKGAISELCKPTQRKYREAIALVFGKLMDAIVVDNAQTGEECISYLKEQRAGKATFLPLSDLRPPPLDENFRRLGGTVRPVLDILTFRQEFRAAIQYAAGSALICDTLEEARRVRFGPRGVRVKICSLDGTLISPSGFITGGVSVLEEGATSKWDRSEIEMLKKRRDNAVRQLEELPGPSEERRRESEAVQKELDSRSTLAQLQIDLKQKEARLSRFQTVAEEAEQALEAVEGEFTEVESTLAERDASVALIRTGIETIEERVFTDFIKRANSASIREFEETVLQRVESLEERKLSLKQQLSKVESHLDYLRSKDVESPVKRLEDSLSGQSDMVQALQREEQDFQQNKEKRERLLTELEDSTRSIATRYETLEVEQTRRKAELTNLSEIFGSHRKVVTALETQVESQRSRQKELLRYYRMEQIKVRFNRESEDGTVEPFELSAVETGDLPQNVVLDVTSLNRRQREASTSDARAEFETKFANQCESLQNQLDKLAPNLRAPEHMTDIEQRVEGINREFEDARKEASKFTRDFEEVRKRRYDLFMECFNHVAENISDVYKELTRSAAYPMGGTAYLTLESEEEPYLSGIKYNAMPPTKRFRDMDQLSGGERTVAALALLFAFHNFRPAPFLVLDEVDAALDNLNLARVSGYIRRRAADLQMIVISLKDFFFEKADALVGVLRKMDDNKSNILTLELMEFDDSQDEADPLQTPSAPEARPRVQEILS